MDVLAHMRVFRAVVERDSFSKAALELNQSAAAISKQVRQLEERLGTLLLVRTTRRMSLSDGGRAYYLECCRLLDEIAALEVATRGCAGKVAGRLRVNAPLSFGLKVLSPLLPAFMARYPDVRPELTLDDRLRDVVGEGYDVSLRIRAALADSTLVARRLGDVEQMICAAPAYLARRGIPASIADLDGHDCIAYGRGDGSPMPWLFPGDNGGQVEYRLASPRMTVGDAEARTAAVLAGLGVAQLATWLVQEYLATGAIVAVLPALATPGLPLYLAWPLARQLTPKTGPLLQELRQRLTIS